MMRYAAPVRPRSKHRFSASLALALCVLGANRAGATMPPAAGPVVPEIAQAFERGLFALPPLTPGLSTSSSVRSEWLLPIIRVAFSDSAIVYPAAQFTQRLFDTTGAVPTGSMTQYYFWASGRRITVRGEVVATVRLPHDRNYYSADAWGVNAQGTPNNDYGLFRDAIAACDASVDFSRFDLDHDGYVDMLWIVHAGPGGETSGRPRDLWSLTSRATAAWRGGSVVPTDDPGPRSGNHPQGAATPTARSLRHLHPRRLEERRTGQLVAHVHGQLRRGRPDPGDSLGIRRVVHAPARMDEPDPPRPGHHDHAPAQHRRGTAPGLFVPGRRLARALPDREPDPGGVRPQPAERRAAGEPGGRGDRRPGRQRQPHQCGPHAGSAHPGSRRQLRHVLRLRSWRCERPVPRPAPPDAHRRPELAQHAHVLRRAHEHRAREHHASGAKRFGPRPGPRSRLESAA